MAEKRAFTKKVTESDAFLDMPLSSQCLYFHLNMNADDDGFINNPKKVMRMIGASEDDLKILISKRFLLVFEQYGLLLVKHWWLHNILKSDRYKETEYLEAKELVSIKQNRSYTLKDGTNMGPKRDLNKIESKTIESNTDIKTKSSKTPTLEEIRDYCHKRNNNVDPDYFYEYYKEGGWRDKSGQPVKNWKQKIITWEKHNQSKVKPDEKIPVYDTSKNNSLSMEEEQELLNLMKGQK